MLRRTNIDPGHPLRGLFRRALDFGLRFNPSDKTEVADYLEEQILCEFIHVDNLYRIKDTTGKSLEDIADLLSEGDVLLKAQSFSREFQVHKHIGDYTLFMLGMFPEALSRKRGKELILGRLVIPDTSLSKYYMLQGQRSYRIASEFTHRELFLELSSNFLLYKNVLDLVRIYLESIKNREFLKAKRIISGTD
ncbi:MAG: hypothetical protein QMC83_00665 [Thermodesulfovibrionales bacterium]|nr:hypothetical protein [Thermodesulfovibrionales bacterium]